MKLKEKLERLQRAAPKVSLHGQLYARKADTQRLYRRVTLWTLFVSEEKTHLLRNHVFDKKEHRTAAQWDAWFAEHLTRIQQDFVLPGIALRTGKSWAVQRILGWTGHAKYSVVAPKVAKRRHKTKRQGRKNG